MKNKQDLDILQEENQMTNLENIKTMETHFFEAPNKITVSDADALTVITAELNDLNFESDFTLDAKSFNMLKKMKTERTIKIEGTTLIIKSKEGKYKCNLVDKAKPKIKIEDIVYEGDYKLSVLKNASKFVDTKETRPQLNGVLFDNVGNVYATDTIKVYKYGSNLGTNRFWSVPLLFINLLDKDALHIKFTDTQVIYDGEYNINGRLYSGDVPKINTVIDKVIANNTIELKFDKMETLNFYESDCVDIDMYFDKIDFTFSDDINEFKVSIAQANKNELKIRVGYTHFMTIINIFNNSVTAFLPESNKQPIYFNNNEEKMILMQMLKNN